MTEKLTAGRRRPGLTTAQRAHLAALEGKTEITAYEQGTLAAFRLFGDQKEADRAARVLRRHKAARAEERLATEVLARLNEGGSG